MFGRKKDVKKIYKTTDGLFNGRDDIKKPRPVAVVDQRKDDGALALVKLHSKKGKNNNTCVEKLVLKPTKHKALSEESIVEKTVRFGRKTDDGIKPIYKGDLKPTKDKLTRKEYAKVKKGIRGNTAAQKAKHKAKMKKWHRHFKA